MAPEDHYRTLGVDRSASVAEIRRAYIDLARRYHPDHQHAVDAEVAESAAARMQAINGAWRVLSDEAARAEFDALAARSSPDQLARFAAPPPPTTSDGEGGFLVSQGVARAMRAAPWAGAAVLAFILLVVTAYAAAPSDDDVVRVGDCIIFQGPAAHEEVPCSARHDAVVAAITFGGCTADQSAFQPRSSDATYCLVGVGR